MRNALLRVLGISLISTTLAVAQVPPPNQAGKTDNLVPPVTVLLKKLVCFLTVDYQAGMKTGTIRGTAIFVFVDDKRLGENSGFSYLVTNRHMAAPVVDGRTATVRRISLRLNLRSPVGDSLVAEGDLPVTISNWYFPKDDAVDLAVLPLAPDRSRFDYELLPVSFFATKETIESSHIAEGDPVLFTGFFYQFPGKKKIEPIVRQGVLAMMPDEPLETTLHKPGRLYLADVHVFGGNSGAPMFVNIGGLRNGMLSLGSEYRLLGVVSGYFNETSDFQLEVATTLSGQVSTNSGIAVVVPVDELKSLLNSPEVTHQRDAQVIAATKK
jgi:hypothetical protein